VADSVVFEGIGEFDAAIDELIERAGAGAQQFVAKGGLLIEAEAESRAPVQTGTLRRSIHVGSVSEVGLGRWQSETYPSTIYSRRIELGFHGNDSLGRHYDQAGQPYLSPGLSDAMPGLRALHVATMAAAMEI